ncbi:hypothetical protein SEA_ACTINUP_91 [Mycobacterium phage ActinUp]|uniref:Uncharacterized protein n=1 Tax=Mycobacterium phage Adephagia TaxID=1034127 RepID=G1BPU3_9CAUD|nr:hypothetical protein I5G89_gp11 [Mycobacterium phage Adephagia]AEJ95858.1 hypothetical protein ADEPHAGIA_89 [Mycobacterium phage Adephagia]AOQ29148.1 hypothetical protein SEA_HEDWIGODU_90 [Mycobacterium phage HedwigODU]AVR76301.1 hypothetical protein SEA_ACTINUP_91 [Mycobacterium phage ActinUp]
MFKMIVQLHGRQEVTEHDTIDEARKRLVDIAVASNCRVEGDNATGVFIALTREGRDNPLVDWTYGAYRITEEPAGGVDQALAAATARYMIDENLDADTVQMIRNSDRDGRDLLAAIVAEWLKLHPELSDRDRHAVAAAANGWQRFDYALVPSQVRYVRDGGELAIVEYDDERAARSAELYVHGVCDAALMQCCDLGDVDRWLVAAPVPL